MIGERVRLAREATKLTQRQLADRSGVPIGTLGPVENARLATLASAHILGIAEATGFPPSFFELGPLPDMPEGRFRKRAKGRAKDEKQLRAHARLIVELVRTAEDKLDLPAVRIKPVADISSLEEIENIAQMVREQLGVGARDPIPNFMRAVERAGVVVARLPHEFPDHSAYSAWPDVGFGGRPLIAIAAGQPGDRERASLGHELGHIVLHTRRPEVDPKVAEKEAYRFAGAVLFPREAAEETLKSPVTLRILMSAKATFGTSIALNARRSLDLGLISHDHFVSLNKQLSARGWRRDEPVNVIPESPSLLSKVIDQIGGVGSHKERADRLHMNYFFFAALSSTSPRADAPGNEGLKPSSAPTPTPLRPT